MPNPTIEMWEVSFSYPGGKGVRGVSITVWKGECLGLLGRNGSGKTTLTHLLLGLHELKSGSIRVFGHPVSNGSRSHLGRIGFAPDRPPLWENLSGYRNAYFTARAYGCSRDHITHALEKLFESACMEDQAHEPVSTYSFGMKKKLGLIQALCHDPELLILDEPTAGVDPQFMGVLTQVVLSRKEKGMTTWIASNDADWLAGVDPGILIMEEGRVVGDGTVDSLLDQVSALEEVRVVLDGYLPLSPPEMTEIRSFHQEGNILVMLMPPNPRLLPEIMRWIVSQGVGVRSMACSGAGLKEAFLLRTGRPVNG